MLLTPFVQPLGTVAGLWHQCQLKESAESLHCESTDATEPFAAEDHAQGDPQVNTSGRGRGTGGATRKQYFDTLGLRMGNVHSDKEAVVQALKAT